MKKLIVTAMIAITSSSAFAYGMLQSQERSGSVIICHYSDGSMITVGMGGICPRAI